MAKRQKRRRKQKITLRDKVFREKEKLEKMFKKVVESKICYAIIKIVKSGYKAITVVTTLFAFICVPIFVYGLIARRNISDNDLIMQQIKAEAGDGVITSLDVSDIHGFGYNSIIVSVADEKFYSDEVNNKLLIMDYIDDSFLRTMYDLFGVKCAYKTTLSYTLYDNAGEELYPKVINVMDIGGDTCKEIIVKYGIHKQETMATNVNLFAVFQYSYEKEKYELKGTYPNMKKYDLVTEEDDGNTLTITRTSEVVETDFHNFYNENPPGVVTCHDSDNNNFNLTPYINSMEMQFWVHGNNTYGDMLVLVHVDRDEDRALINCYVPLVSQTEEEIEWRVMYSEYMNTSKDECKKEVIEKLETDLCESFEIIQEISR